MNLIIAMMGESFEKVLQAAQRELTTDRAEVLVRVELTMGVAKMRRRGYLPRYLQVWGFSQQCCIGHTPTGLLKSLGCFLAPRSCSRRTSSRASTAVSAYPICTAARVGRPLCWKLLSRRHSTRRGAYPEPPRAP